MQEDKEIEAMVKVKTTLEELNDTDAVARVLEWALKRFNITDSVRMPVPPTLSQPSISQSENQPQAAQNEIPGIARLGSDGKLKITIRDAKARSKADATLRFALVIIYAHKLLTGSESASSRHVLTPLLKEWRLYDGNARAALSAYPGIIRDGDALSLDAPATLEAEKIISEIKDPEIVGKWK